MENSDVLTLHVRLLDSTRGMIAAEQEPVVDGQYPLLAMENVVCSPHLGYGERDGLDRFFADGRPINVVHPAALAQRAR